MMPQCDISSCEEVAEKIYATTEEFIYVAVCPKHNPESARRIRRFKLPSDPKYTKKRKLRK